MGASIRVLILCSMLFPTMAYLSISKNTKIGLSFFVCSFFLLSLSSRATKLSGTLKKYLILAVLFLATQTLLLLSPDSNYLSFFQATFFVSAIFIFIIFEPRLKRSINKEVVLWCAKTSLTVVFFTCILQAFEFYLLQSSELLKLISSIQINDNFYILNQLSFGKFRAIGLYYEPSYLAMMSLFFWVIINSEKEVRNKSADVMLISICALAGSAALISGTLLLFSVRYFSTSKISYKSLTLTYIALPILLVVIFYTATSTDYLSRVGEINQGGSSGFYRLIAPLGIIKWILLERILPVPLGSLADQFYKFGLVDEVGKTFDNGYYILIANFSWLGIATILFFFTQSFKRARSSYINHDPKALIWVFILILPFFNGLIFSPELLLIGFYLIIVCRSKERAKYTTIHYNR